MPISTMDSPVKFDSLRSGQTVKVLTDRDVRNLGEFTATEIDIFE